MDTTNPYQAPQADLEPAAIDGEFDHSNVFSPKGRFGRLSYLAWGTMIAILSWVLMGLLVGVEGFVEAAESGNQFAFYFQNPVVGLVTIASLVIGLIFAVRRLHDMNASGWWSILILIPFVNLFATLAIVFVPGTRGHNRFGPPRFTRGWEKWLGLLLPIVFLLGILAAIAVPAYQGYVEAARQAAGG